MRHLERNNIAASAWDRAATPIDDYWAIEAYLRHVRPDVVFHLAVASQATGRPNEGWLVNFEWPSELAHATYKLGIRFLFTSSVMVYTQNQPGPYTLSHPADADSGYGFEKLVTERRVQYQNPDCLIVRLGWQIGSAAGSNNMIDHLSRQMAAHGVVRASRRWLPACSLVGDTAAALCALGQAAEPDLYLLDSNRGHSYYDIVCALNALHGHPWQVEPDDDFVYDQRMIDPRVPLATLAERLPSLPPLPAAAA